MENEAVGRPSFQSIPFGLECNARDIKYRIGAGERDVPAESLVRLLTELGYQRHGLGFRYPSRRVIFVGDFIDRGPAIRDILQIGWAMVDADAVQAVMGNHEFNAFAFHTPHSSNSSEFPRPICEVTSIGFALCPCRSHY